MKALSVRQPWAHLILSGDKTIEVRSWKTNYRGQLLICTSQAEKNYFFEVPKHLSGNKADELLLMPFGVTFCLVDLVDIRPLKQQDKMAAFLEDDFDIKNQYAWILENPIPVQFNKVLGKLHLFDVDENLITPVLTRKSWLQQVRNFAPNAKLNKNSLILNY